jgi:cyclomaltodextrinase / maltogenic alpha-amylase / neopullulanase
MTKEHSGVQQRHNSACQVPLHYGTEVGLNQNSGKDDGQGLEASRLPMLWGADQDSDLLDFYKQLIQSRKP